MEIIFPACSAISVLPDPDICSDRYKPSQYNVLYTADHEYFVYNTFTRSLVKLSEEDHQILSMDIVTLSNQQISEAIKKLISIRFLVPAIEDETNSYLQFYDILSSLKKNRVKPFVNSYTILPTTACNARCFYCFEADFTPITMDDSMANAVASYIINNRNTEKPVSISWFGGEPLCNVRAIDTISKRLADADIDYSSKMVSNGFLFNRELVEKAKNIWKTRKVQITLDGQEEEHNKRKNYRTYGESPFLRTISNIHLLVDHEIGVSVRLNFDHDNYDSICCLINYMSSEFKGNPYLHMYPAVLFEECGTWDSNRNDTETSELTSKLYHLRDVLHQSGFFHPKPLLREFKMQHCGANNKNHLTINPDGSFNTCQNCVACTYGSVFEGITNSDLFRRWTQSTRIRKKCVGCKYLPECTAFDQCPTVKSKCRENMDDLILRQIKSAILSWKEKHTNKEFS